MYKYTNLHVEMLLTCLVGLVMSSKNVRKNNIGSSTKHSHNVLFAISVTMNESQTNSGHISIVACYLIPEGKLRLLIFTLLYFIIETRGTISPGKVHTGYVSERLQKRSYVFHYLTPSLHAPW